MIPPTYEIEIRGITEQVMRLRGFDFIAGRRFMVAAEQSVKLLERNWKKVAPVDTGRYRSSISGRVKTITGANIVAVTGTDVRSNRGFPYPAALEESARYHYRRGPRRGQLTLLRVRRVLEQAKGSIKKRFNDAAKHIVKDLEI